MSTFNPNDYLLNFQAKKIGLLHNDIILRGIAHLDNLTILHNDDYYYFLPANQSDITNFAHLFFTSAEYVKQGFAELEQAREEIHALRKDIQNLTDLKDTFVQFLIHSYTFLQQYGKTETVFTDVLMVMDKKDIQDLYATTKNIHREYFNEIYFSNESIVSLFIGAFAQHFNVSRNAIVNSTPQNILQGFDSKKLPVINDAPFVNCAFMKAGDTFKYASAEELQTLIDTFLPKNNEIANFVTGTSVSIKGVFTGPVVKVVINYKDLSGCLRDLDTKPEGFILVTQSTIPELVPYMKKALAIVTDMGGLLSHAAISSRELQKPCVVGTKWATSTFNDGNMVQVNADTGVVTKL